jgi:hypothetical protein
MSDVAGSLGNVVQAIIPTERRMDVFVCPGVPEEALARWLTQGGASNFHHAECSANLADWGKDLSKLCGIALFVLGPYGFASAATAALLAPFYAQAGNEANCFQWCPIEKNFTRRDPEWLQARTAS